MGYQEDYERAAAEMKIAAEELRKAEIRVMSLQKRMAALVALIALDKPEAEHNADEKWALTKETQAWMNTSPRIADQIRLMLANSADAMTVKEIRAALRATGMDLSAQANPASTIGSVCGRLVEQGFAEELSKNGRKAWKKILKPSL